MYFARHLGLGMRYGGGTCTIVISMNGVFKRCPFCCKLTFDPKSWKTMDYAFARVRFLAKMWPTLKSTFRTSFERFFHVDCNGAIPSFISHSRTKIRCVFHLTLEAKCFELYTYSTYVGIGMIQSWTIAICMNGTFKWCPFLILSPNTNKGITYGFDSVRYWQIWETLCQTLGNCQNVLEVDFVTHFQLLVVSCKNHRSPQVKLRELSHRFF